jgi:lipopolysaccharide transport protein LptA
VGLNIGVQGTSDGQEKAPSKSSSNTKSSLPVQKQRGPIVITGDGFEADYEKKLIIYTGNVKVVQGEMSMFCDRLDIVYSGQTGKKLEKAVATGNVRLVNGEITATGEEGIFYNEEQKIELNRNAKVWQDNNTVTAHRIVAYLETEIVEGYSKDGSERAIMTVYSKGGEGFPGEEPAKASDNTASDDQDASPIVIISDELKLDNPAQLATFTGDVVATKDITEIRSDEMFVYITRTEETGDDIERIDVKGNVKIVRETTTVTGDSGFFLNQEQFAEITGTKQKKARVEDTAQNMVHEAPTIQIYLQTNMVKAKGERIRTEFGGEEEPEETPEVDRDKLPSVTIYPKKNN